MRVHVPRKLISDYKRFIQSTIGIGLEINNTAELINGVEIDERKYTVSLRVKREK
jgi:hypothetical protein